MAIAAVLTEFPIGVFTKSSMQPIVTRSGRVIHFGGSSPDIPSPRSPPSSGSTPPRAPVVHFFISDHGNVKVKALGDQFVSLLTRNGVNVYCERYQTHQPGYQVRAAALNSSADFFFQIHSKTAGPGHVRLYIGGQPRRMGMEEAVASVWSLWRVQCGALTRDEVELLSPSRTLELLREFGEVEPRDLDFDDLQMRARSAIADGESPEPVLDRVRECEAVLQNARRRILAARGVATDWAREPGALLQRILPAPRAVRLSPPLKEMLLSAVDQAAAKARAIGEVVQRYAAALPADAGAAEIPIDADRGDASSWRMLIESFDEDHTASMRIASYGDSRGSPDLPTTAFMLDDF
jgi:hypothetical protein